jgi:TRAP-type transport system small permease protein
MQALMQLLQRAIGGLLVLMLSAMVALTFTDVLGRRLFNSPVFGANDLTEHMMAIIIFAGLPVLTAQRGHLSVDLFDHWLLRSRFRLWHKAVDVLIASVLALVAFEYYVAIGEAKWANEVSPALTIPRHWMYTFITATTAVAAVAALTVPVPQPAHLDQPAEEARS